MNLKCCKVELDCEEAGRRDTETMGGHSVEYFICSKCGQRYELIIDPLDGNSLCYIDSEP